MAVDGVHYCNLEVFGSSQLSPKRKKSYCFAGRLFFKARRMPSPVEPAEFLEQRPEMQPKLSNPIFRKRCRPRSWTWKMLFSRIIFLSKPGSNETLVYKSNFQSSLCKSELTECFQLFEYVIRHIVLFKYFILIAPSFHEAEQVFITQPDNLMMKSRVLVTETQNTIADSACSYHNPRHIQRSKSRSCCLL